MPFAVVLLIVCQESFAPTNPLTNITVLYGAKVSCAQEVFVHQLNSLSDNCRCMSPSRRWSYW